MQPTALSFSEIIKFNPYHDSIGQFSSSGAAASFTYKPGASTAHSKAIEKEKEKDGAVKGFKGTLYHGSPNKDIKEFDMKRAGQNTSSGEKLLFFTDSKQMADDFSYERLDGSSKFFQQRGKKGRVYEVDVEMKNPLDLRKLNDKDIDNILKLDSDGILTKETVKQYANSNHQLLKAGLNLTSDSLKELGYDGLIANTGKAGHNSLEYAVVDSKQAKIVKSDSNRYSIYVGLNLSGGDVSELQIPGGEDVKDYHVTLLYGYFTPQSDIEDSEVRIQSAIDEIKKDIPDRVVFFHEERFEASESSDKKDVIVARAEGDSLYDAHNKLIKSLKRHGIKVEQTFPDYKPHMTLAYIEPGTEYELRVLDHSADVKDISLDIETEYSEGHEHTRHIQKYDKNSIEESDMAKSFLDILKFNPNHDNLGRFSSGSGGAAASGGFVPAKTVDEAQDYAVKHLGMDYADYENCNGDMKTINMINEQITKVYEKYPELKGKVHCIESQMNGLDNAMFAVGPDTFNEGNAFKIGFQMNKGYSEIEKTYQENVEVGFHPKGTTLESAVWHEFGHVYEFESKNGSSGRWLDEARGNQDAHVFQNSISTYATKNPQETFAEAFAEYHTSKTCRQSSVKMMQAAGVSKKPTYSKEEEEMLRAMGIIS